MVYPGFGRAWFEDLVLIDSDSPLKPFAEPGDSGSLVIFDDATDLRPVGLVIGGAVGKVLACKFSYIEGLGLTICS
jgi:hypothetical protein